MAILLATICNMRPPQPSGLVEINLGTGSRKTIALGLTERVLTCTGLAADEHSIYVLSETESLRFFLSVLRRNDYAVDYIQELPGVRDGHSIALSGRTLYIVSTGSDEVQAYELSDRKLMPRGVAWRASEAQRDTHHLNAIAVVEGELLISGFGEKTGQTWSSAMNGYMFNASTGKYAARAVYQPHSICAADGEVYMCESARGRVITLSGMQWQIGGYLRGLASMAKGRMAVGFNVTRKVSKSTGIENNPGDPGAKSGECGIGVYDLTNKEPHLLAQIDLSEHGNEIYDLLCLNPLSAEGLEQKGVSPRNRSQLDTTQDWQQENLLLHVQLTEFAHMLSERQKELDAAKLELESTRDLRQENQFLQSQLVEVTHALSETQKELEIAMHELESREQAVFDARTALKELHASKSWRLTAPLRKIRKMLG